MKALLRAPLRPRLRVSLRVRLVHSSRKICSLLLLRIVCFSALPIFAAPASSSTFPEAFDVAPLPDPARTEALADSFYAYGEFDAAALEYKRALYYSGLAPFLYPDSSGRLRMSGNPVTPVTPVTPATPVPLRGTSVSNNESKEVTPVTFTVVPLLEDSVMTLLKLAVSLYRNGERNEADSILYSIDGSVVRMVRAVILIGEEDPYLATRQIDSAVCSSLGAPAFRLRGWAYLEAKDFESAAHEFANAGDDSLALTLMETRPALKNPTAARWLSIIPGLGETYAGRPLFGFWALLVNAGDTYLVVSNLLAARYLDAVLAYSFLWQRFYTGSMANAERFARQWNERAYEKTLDPIRRDYGENEDLSLDLDALQSLYSLAQQRK